MMFIKLFSLSFESIHQASIRNRLTDNLIFALTPPPIHKHISKTYIFSYSFTFFPPTPPPGFCPPPLIRRVGVVGKKKQGEERIYLNPFKDIGLLDSPIDNPHAKRVRLGVLFGVSRF